MIIFIEITTFLFGVLICPILAFLTLYKTYKQFIKDFNKVIKDSPRMLEIQAKLRGNYDN